jgi:tetratricopeptide (TPR) repeat protein
VTLGLAVTLLSSCAYYNTFYLARKYYFKATDGRPYEVDREGTTQRPNYNKSADYSKKLLGVYPKSKWVDDAWLLWARSLIGTDDPLKAIAMLEDFKTKFPKSDLNPDADFFLGLAYRSARKHEKSVEHFEAFLSAKPKDELAPYAYYERSKALMSLERYQEAAASAGQVLQRWSGHVLADRALRQRAEARYQQRAWQQAREDFQAMGSRALNDDERMRFLLREVDCLEASRDYEAARLLLADARAHVPAPPPVPEAPRVGGTPAGTPPPVQTYVQNVPGADRYGRLTLRMGGVELLAGRTKEAIELYETVLHDYPRSQLSAEAQYRIGYAYETGADDFARASLEYGKVKEQVGTSQFSQQAQQRLDNLDRIQKYRTASGADSAEKQAEASFLVAEHYLFNLDRPERAVEQYRGIADSTTAPAVKARAMNAEAWVLSRKLSRKADAESLFWKVVRDFPKTEAQLAARDYLEAQGHKVSESLIVPPPGLVPPPRPVAAVALTQPPATTPSLGSAPAVDPATHLGPSPSATLGGAGAYGAYSGMPQSYRGAQLPDSLKRVMATRDSVLRVAAQDTSAAGKARVDSLQRAYAKADTAGRAAQMAAIQKSVPVAAGVVLAPGGGTAPNLSSGADGAVRSPSSMSVNSNAPAKPASMPGTQGIEGGAAMAGAGAAYAPGDTAHARADSTRGGSSTAAVAGATAGGAAAARSGSAAATTATGSRSTPAAAPPKPPKQQGGPISSLWITQTKAERDSIKHAKAVADSTKKAEKAAKKAEKQAEKDAEKQAKKAAADSAKAGKP